MLDRLEGHPHFCFLDGYSRYNQIAIAPEDQEKTTFTCPYGTFAFRRMPFGLCNAPATLQRCMIDSCHSRCSGINKIYILNHTAVAELLQYSGSRVEHRDEFSSYK